MPEIKPLNFSIIVPWCGGNPTREQSLKNMLLCLSKQSNIPSDPLIYELIIVEHIKNSTEKDFCKEKIKSIVPETIEYKHIVLEQDCPFNKSWCLNVASKQAKYDNLIFMDADSLFGSDFFKVIKNHIRITPHPNNKIMFCWNYIICLIGKDNPISRHIRPDTTFAMGGIWYADRQFYFNELGGMNENYFGYGGEDNDMYERALHATGLFNISWIPYPLAHQYHDWEIPSHNCSELFEITRNNPKEIIKRLKEKNLGNSVQPTTIQMDDLK